MLNEFINNDQQNVVIANKLLLYNFSYQTLVVLKIVVSILL